MQTTAAIDALTALAAAGSAEEATRMLVSARKLLGDNASEFAPLLEAIEQRIVEFEALRRLAGTDGLTGVANRRCFEQTLTREVSRRNRCAERQRGGDVSLLLLDLDGLKQINDEYGHQTGDEAIRACAKACAAAARSADLVSRLGGDEFAIILADTNLAGARIMADRLRAAIEATVVVGETLAVSIGIATTEGAPLSFGAKELVKVADGDLYRDKRSRRRELARRLGASVAADRHDAPQDRPSEHQVFGEHQGEPQIETEGEPQILGQAA